MNDKIRKKVRDVSLALGSVIVFSFGAYTMGYDDAASTYASDRATENTLTKLAGDVSDTSLN